ncbi:cation:proton antiporter [Methyloceanibacter marginalis]|jgi:multicomponent K+:H+ antiporter subunit F|uniref:Cation:proton antiporter n=1 Tax=Methyloceanibacter marginalis TaxID=1774971 RepID=A0A1E3WB01_9HYPH|nr:K+/H+ antiporter subunit F [Methyloceanibacter marginalis]ODS02966.1 cation:proton antiporter [Methyloceanibacter marginalis]
MIALSCTIAAFAIGAAMLLNVYRLLVGPDTQTRVLALDTLVINAIALVVLTGIYYGTEIYFEAALLFAMVGFLTTVAYCKYLLRGNVME